MFWSTGLWNGQFFSGVPGTKEKSAFNFSFVDTEERKDATYTVDPNVISYTLMDPSGQVKPMLWMNTSQRWFSFYNQPGAQCDVYSVCGLLVYVTTKAHLFVAAASVSNRCLRRTGSWQHGHLGVLEKPVFRVTIRTYSAHMKMAFLR